MTEIAELGTDINREWKFENGDLIIVSDTENLKQAIYNRITCLLDSFDDFYEDYGSILMKCLGSKKDDDTLAFFKIELENVLKQDPRTQNADVELEYVDDGLKITILIDYLHDYDFSMSLVISDDKEVIIDGSE